MGYNIFGIGIIFSMLFSCATKISTISLKNLKSSKTNRSYMGFFLNLENPHKEKFSVNLDIVEVESGNRYQLEKKIDSDSKKGDLIVFEIPKGTYSFKSTTLKVPYKDKGGDTYKPIEVHFPLGSINPYWTNEKVTLKENEIMYVGIFGAHYSHSFVGIHGTYKAYSVIYLDENPNNIKSYISKKRNFLIGRKLSKLSIKNKKIVKIELSN